MRTQVSKNVLSESLIRESLSVALLLSSLATPFLTCLSNAYAQPRDQKAAETGSSISDEKVDEETLAKDSSTEINVKNADITAIIRIFSKKTRRNFILDERVKGKVSIYLPGRVSSEESMRILDSVLAYKGFASVPIGKNLWKIVPAKEAKSSTIPTQRDNPDGTPGPEVVTRLVQLKYINADEVRQLLSQLISTDGFLSAYAATNSLVLIDSEDNIARLLDIVDTMDVPFSNREMTIIPIVNAEAKDIADKVNELLGLGSAQGAGSSGGSAGAAGNLDFGLELARARVRQMAMQNANAAQAGINNNIVQGGAAGGGEASSNSVGSRASQPKILADERTNSLILVADEDTTARVRALVSQLDSKVDMSGAQYWVYRCQHASADDLADVLGGLVGKGGSSRSTTSTGGNQFDTNNDLISGGASNRQSSRQSGTQNRLRSQNRTPGQSRNQASTGGGVSSVELSEELSIRETSPGAC
jgi:general secretion pathway protein D